MVRRTIVMFAAILCLVSMTAFADTIGIYDDPTGIDCNIIDDTIGLKSVYVVHLAPSGATASEFSAPKPACWTTATWLSDTVAFEMPGNSQVGISIGYGICQLGPSIHILTINYFVQGDGEPCCQYPVLPHPSWPDAIHVVDCDNNLLPATGLVATINTDSTCPCGYPVPVEDTTWGKVKNLYSQ